MSPSLSVAVFASTALLSTIREGIESLGHLVVLVENPANLGENIELPHIDLLFIALDQETEEALDRLDNTLNSAAATLFDEAENKQSWTPARWAQHLHPKLLKIGRRQELEKLPLTSAPLPSTLTQEAEKSFDETPAIAWDLIEESSETAFPHSFDEPSPPVEPVLAPAPVFDGGFDFYDDEPSMLGSMGAEEHQEALVSAEHTPPHQELSPETRHPFRQEPDAPPAAMDFSSLSLMSDDDVLPEAVNRAVVERPILDTPQWSLDGEEPAAQPENTAGAPEHVFSEAPAPDPVEVPETSIPTPIFHQNQGLVLIGGGIGGPGALVQLMEHLPAGLPVPLAVVQPLPQGRQEVFAANLQKRTSVPVELGALGQVLTPGHITLLPEAATVALGELGWQIEAGNPADTIALLGEDSALVLLSGTPGSWVIPAMEAVGMGALLLGQEPSQALEAQTISTLIEIGLTPGTQAEVGEHLAHRWGLALA